MPVKLYHLLGSPPARAVLLTLKMLNVPYELVEASLLKGDNKSEEFLKLNPQHTIPVLIDEDGFVVSDSHAINAYLVNKYAKDDKLYPKDLKAKTIVDQRLFFDCGVLFRCVYTISKAYFFEKIITGLTKVYVDPILDGYETLERYLSSTQYIAGDQVTIADFSVLTTLANMGIFVPVDEEKFPKLAGYMQRCDETIPPLKELNASAVEQLKGVYFKDFNFQMP